MHILRWFPRNTSNLVAFAMNEMKWSISIQWNNWLTTLTTNSKYTCELIDYKSTFSAAHSHSCGCSIGVPFRFRHWTRHQAAPLPMCEWRRKSRLEGKKPNLDWERTSLPYLFIILDIEKWSSIICWLKNNHNFNHT